MATGSGGNFISKPPRGWLHPDHLVSKEGITYAVRVSFALFFVTNIKIALKNFFQHKILLLVHWIFGGLHVHEKPGL